MGHYFKAHTPRGVERWRITVDRMPQNQHQRNWGLCDFEKKTITIHYPLSALEMLQTIIHEASHAALDEPGEAPIERLENTITAALMPYLKELAEDLFYDEVQIE